MAHRLVVHCKRAEYDVYIGRPSKWGNPFEIGRDGTREEVIAKFAEQLGPNGRAQARLELAGKVLGCWCAPKACHGDVLAEIANSQGGGGPAVAGPKPSTERRLSRRGRQRPGSHRNLT